MKIVIIGATGFVGTHILKEAVGRGHQVIAIARNPEKISPAKGLTVVNTNIFDTEVLVETIGGSDVVISAFNPGWTNPDIYSLFLSGSTSIQNASREAGVPRLITIGGAGSLFIGDQQIVDLPSFPADIYAGASAARDYLNMIKTEKQLDWTVLSPPGNLFSGERTGKYRMGTDNPVNDAEGKNAISVQDLAVALLDEAERGEFLRQRFTVGY